MLPDGLAAGTSCWVVEPQPHQLWKRHAVGFGPARWIGGFNEGVGTVGASREAGWLRGHPGKPSELRETDTRKVGGPGTRSNLAIR